CSGVMPAGVNASGDTATVASLQADDKLRRLYGEYHRWSLDSFGMYETEAGAFKRGGDLPSASAEAEQARAKQVRAFLARLDAIDVDALAPAERVNAEVLRA